MAITVHLDQLLKARGITGKELCAKVGITEANLSILRSGKASGVRFHTIRKRGSRIVRGCRRLWRSG